MTLGKAKETIANAPEGLDEAAKRKMPTSYGSLEVDCYGGSEPVYSEEQMIERFKAGAEWAFGQGYSQEYRIQYNEGVSDTSTRSRQMTFTIPVPNDFLDGDNMIVQIRKK